MTIDQAIEESIRENRIVRCAASLEEIYAHALIDETTGEAGASSVEAWGTDDDGKSTFRLLIEIDTPTA